MVVGERVYGTVTHFDMFSGTGTIVLSDGRKAMVRYSSIRGHGIRQVMSGTPVTCLLEETRRGLTAVCVELV